MSAANLKGQFNIPTQAEIDDFTSAALIGNIGGVTAFLDKYPNSIDARDSSAFNEPALIRAANRPHKKVVELLLEKGAAVDAGDRYNKSALQYAAECGDEDMVELFLKSGAFIDKQAGTEGETALMLAAMHGHIKVMKVLLDHGALTEVINRNRHNTALMLAARNGKMDAVKLLLERGADPEKKDKHGKTAAGYAQTFGHTKIVAVLEEWQEKQEEARRAQRLKETNFSKGLDNPIPAPRKIKLSPRS
jgi:ankyrin repeat protein